MKRKNNNKIFLALSSSLCSGIYNVITKKMTLLGANTATITCCTGVLAALIIYILLRVMRINIILPASKMKKALLLCSVGGSGTTILLTLAYMYLPVGTTMTIHYMYPVIVNLFCVIVYHSKLSKSLVITLIAAGIGIVQFFEGGGGDATVVGIVSAAASSFCWAFYLIYTDRSGLSEENPMLLAFYLCLFNIVLGTAMGGITGFSLGRNGVLILLAAAISFALVYLTMVLAVRSCGAELMSVLSVCEPISAILLGYALLHDTLNSRQLMGVFIVLTSILYLLISDYIQSKNESLNSFY